MEARRKKQSQFHDVDEFPLWERGIRASVPGIGTPSIPRMSSEPQDSGS